MKVVVLALAAAAALASCVAPPRPAPPLVARQCQVELDRRGVEYGVAPLAVSVSACAVDDPIKVSADGVAWSQPGIVACRFALTLDDFTRDAVEPLAQRYFRKRVTSLRHYGTYACRTTHSGHESRHAQGEAIDIAGFVLADGTIISVEHDWRSGGAAGRFLHALAREACGRFSVVLTPDFDRDHFNHIHLDSGPYNLCGVRSS